MLDEDKISQRSFLVSGKGVLPLASLGGSMETVPRRQFFQASTLRYIEVCPENALYSYPLGDYLHHFFYRADGTASPKRIGRLLTLMDLETADDCVQVDFCQPTSLNHIVDTFESGQYLKFVDLDNSIVLKLLFDDHKTVLTETYLQLKTMTENMQPIRSNFDFILSPKPVSLFDRLSTIRDLSQATAAMLTSCIPVDQSEGISNPLEQDEATITSIQNLYLNLNRADQISLNSLIIQKLRMGQEIGERENLTTHNNIQFEEALDRIPFNQENPIHFFLANLYFNINIYRGVLSSLRGLKTLRTEKTAKNQPLVDISPTLVLVEKECNRINMLSHALMLLYFPLHFTRSRYQPLVILDGSFVVFDSKAFPPEPSGWLYTPHNQKTK